MRLDWKNSTIPERRAVFRLRGAERLPRNLARIDMMDKLETPSVAKPRAVS
jgi:hypothetical protein